VRLSVERLEAIGEPPSLAELRATVAAMLPRVDLPELLLEVQEWTGFLDEYVHVGELAARMDDLPVTVAALLVAEACNVGLTPVTKPGIPALTRDRLSHVDQNYLRSETHSAANARLIEAQGDVEVAATPSRGEYPGAKPVLVADELAQSAHDGQPGVGGNVEGLAPREQRQIANHGWVQVPPELGESSLVTLLGRGENTREPAPYHHIEYLARDPRPQQEPEDPVRRFGSYGSASDEPGSVRRCQQPDR
jgi:hypothetical protein